MMKNEQKGMDLKVSTEKEDRAHGGEIVLSNYPFITTH